MTQAKGYTQDLFILAFDHRGSFQKKLFGIEGTPTEAQTQEIGSYKNIIFEGFLKALETGVSKNKAGILIDEQFGKNIFPRAKKLQITFACPSEKSGQSVFDFEHGDQYQSVIKNIAPSFVKVLVRYNPEGDLTTNQLQNKRLKALSDFCHQNGHRFLFELLVPPTQEQLQKAGGEKARYDQTIRPSLMVQAISKIQDDGIEPDVWKIEGLDHKEDAQKVVDQIKSEGRTQVGVVILGRGENAQKVDYWLKTAAQVPGFIGFAVGRTIFWEPLKSLREGKTTRNQAIDAIAENYKHFVTLWEHEKKAH